MRIRCIAVCRIRLPGQDAKRSTRRSTANRTDALHSSSSTSMATKHRCCAGAARLVETDRPVIVMELAPYGHVEQGERSDAVELLLKSWGYGLHDLAGRPLPAGAGQRLRAGSSINVIARPVRDRDATRGSAR